MVPLIYDAFIERNKVFRFKYVTNIPMKDYIYNKCLYKQCYKWGSTTTMSNCLT